MNWQLQEAKNKFSQVVKMAWNEGPQVVTVHGQTSVVVLSIAEFDRLNDVREESLASFLKRSPLSDQEQQLKIERCEPINAAST